MSQEDYRGNDNVRGMSVQYSQEFNIHNVKSIFNNILSNTNLKAIIAVLSVVANWVYGAQKEALMVVFALVIMDTITGTLKAIKRKDLKSCGFFRFAAKIVIYLILMATASLVDKVLPIQFGAAIMYSFLAVTEAISILENVTILGWPVPSRLINMLRNMDKEPKDK